MTSLRSATADISLENERELIISKTYKEKPIPASIIKARAAKLQL
jgi:hypothetical protein